MARIKSSNQAGRPAIKKLRRGQWPKVPKPMRSIGTVRTLRKVDESLGKTMPESRNLLQRAGVGTRQKSPGSVLIKSKTASANRGKTVVRPPSPTNRGGVRSPFRKGRGS